MAESANPMYSEELHSKQEPFPSFPHQGYGPAPLDIPSDEVKNDENESDHGNLLQDAVANPDSSNSCGNNSLNGEIGFPSFASKESRLASFEELLTSHPECNIEVLAEDGFFYSGGSPKKTLTFFASTSGSHSSVFLRQFLWADSA